MAVTMVEGQKPSVMMITYQMQLSGVVTREQGLCGIAELNRLMEHLPPILPVPHEYLDQNTNK